jgi:uncharacterized protein (TIGR03000 family)
MYSIVLMMALGGGAEAPAFGRGCDGCNGGGCHGGLFSGRGCHGGGLFSGRGCHGGRGHGCHGGGYACNGGGCHGGGSACHGGGGCHGGYGCNGGGCHGGGLFHRRGHGCHGGYACNGGGCHGGSACHGGGGCHGGCHAAAPGCHGDCHGAPAAPPAKKAPKEGEKIPVPPKAKTEADVAAPATLVVTLPAEAKLLIDDKATVSTSGTRVFASPTLEPGKEFAYTLKGELVRDGRTFTTTKEVIVRAGEEIQVQLEFPTVSVAQK